MYRNCFIMYLCYLITLSWQQPYALEAWGPLAMGKILVLNVFSSTIFVHDGINNFVADYNSSRVGVVCMSDVRPLFLSTTEFTIVSRTISLPRIGVRWCMSYGVCSLLFFTIIFERFELEGRNFVWGLVMENFSKNKPMKFFWPPQPPYPYIRNSRNGITSAIFINTILHGGH